MNRCACIIPARGGSTRIPRKNIKLFHGKPVIAYSIEAAIKSALFEDVYVSTEDDEIAKVADQYGARVWHRDITLADDKTGTQEVMREALLNQNYDLACCLYATAPLVSIRDLRQGYHIVRGGLSEYAFSVGTKPALHDAGQFYWGCVGAFLNREPLVGPWTRMVVVDPERDCDINMPEDWMRAEQMFLRLGDRR